MDTHHGKYSGPLAALTENWYLDGDLGDEYFSNGMGEGTVLWRGPITLSYREAKYLREHFEVTEEELDELDAFLGKAAGIGTSWDDQGFISAATYGTVDEYEDEVARLHEEYGSWEPGTGWEDEGEYGPDDPGQIPTEPRE